MILSPTIIPVLAGLVGAIFGLAALLKAFEATELMIHVGKLLTLPPRFFRWIRRAVPVAIALEGMLGVALIVALWPRWLIPAAFFLVLIFAGVSLWGVKSGRVEDCGCYGGPIVVTPAVSLLLDAVYAAMLGAAWYFGIEASYARWKLDVVMAVGAALGILAEVALRHGESSRGPLVDWSPFRVGRPWRSRWLGDPSRFPLAEGEHVVAFMAPDCPTCKSWLKPLAFAHGHTELPDVVAAYGANEEEVERLRSEFSLPFPTVALGRWPMRRLSRHLPRGVVVEHGMMREVWRGGMSEAFVERLRDCMRRRQEKAPALKPAGEETVRRIAKPEAGEFAPYASMYIDLLPDDGLILQHLRSNFETTRNLILSLPEGKLIHRYAPGKWTIKEILVHIVDDERIYSYRALRFARNDPTELPGFDQDVFARHSGADERGLDDIFEEYEAVRSATITLFGGLEDEAFLRRGTADGNVMSVRAAVYHLAGHELHHMNVIREKYL